MKKQTIAKLLVLCLMVTMVLPVSAAEANAPQWTDNKEEIKSETTWSNVTVGVAGVNATYELTLDTKLTVNDYIIVNDANTLNVKGKSNGQETNLATKGFKLDGTATLNLENVYFVENDTVCFVGVDTTPNATVAITGGSLTSVYVGKGVTVDMSKGSQISSSKVTVEDGGKCTFLDENGNVVTLPKPAEPTPSYPSTPSTSTVVTDKTVTTTLQPTTSTSGSATVNVSTATGSAIVNTAVNNKAEEIELKLDSKADKATVNLPTTVAKDIADRTDATLNVVTNNATVTIPNSALETLAGEAKQTVGVTVAKNDDNTVTVSVTADGKPVESAKGLKATLDAGEKATKSTVVVIVNEDGSETVVKKAVVDKNGNITAPLTEGVTKLKVIEDKSIPYTDVPEEFWGNEAIKFASSHGLFKGVTETEFEPESNMTRAMLATVLYRLEDAVANGKGSFADVPDDTWYTDAVKWAYDSKITEGNGEGFDPNGNITRQDMVTMLYRYAEALGMDLAVNDDALKDFTDSENVSDYASDAMKWAVSKGLINGMGDGTVNPTGTATRAQVATLLMRLVEIM